MSLQQLGRVVGMTLGVFLLVGSCSHESRSPAQVIDAEASSVPGPPASAPSGWVSPANAEPRERHLVAKFTAAATSGNSPLLVRFTDLSTGDATAWSWDFGDGEVSSVRNPAHVYTAVGSHSVGLVVQGGGEADARFRPDFVTVTGAGPPCPTPPTNTFTLHSDIVYGSGNCASNNAQCLDVYVPDNPRACSPTLMWVHGGGFRNGSKTDGTTFPLCNRLAQQGWYVVAVNYRLSTYNACGNLLGSGTYPDAIQDVKLAVDWIHSVGTAMFDLPDTVVGVGSSTGAYLVSMAASTMGPGEGFFDPFPAGNFVLDRAILFSPSSNFVAVGCEGNVWSNPDCVTNCPAPASPPFDDCSVPPDCLKTGGFVPGWPCRADSGNCRDFVGAEFFFGELWPLGGDPVGVDCSDPFSLPGGMTTMPTLNPWYDASTYFWVSGDEPPIHLFYNECDPLAPTPGHEAFVGTLNAHGITVDAVVAPAAAVCDVGCRHGAFQSFGFAGAATRITGILADVYGS